MYDELLKKILIVEDDVDYRKILVSELFREYTVIEAMDGEEAVDKLLVHKPDLVILDLLLPKLDGFEVLKRIREYPDESIAKTPVIILSNLSGNQEALDAQFLKVDGYFVKSNTQMEQLLVKIREVLFFKKPEESDGEKEGVYYS